MTTILRSFFVLLTIVLIIAYLWLTRPFSQFGIGSHLESFDNYVLRIPYGWTATILPDPKNPDKPGRVLAAVGGIWFSNCTIRILSPAEIASENKTDNKFPFMQENLKLLKQKVTFTPVSKLNINGISFEKASWSVAVGKREIGGVEYQSIPNKNEDTIRIEATQGFGQHNELDQAEYIVRSLRRKSES